MRRILLLSTLIGITACASRPENVGSAISPVPLPNQVDQASLAPGKREALRALLAGRQELRQALEEALVRDLTDWLAVEEARWAEAPVKLEVFPRLGLVQASRADYDFHISGSARLVEQDDPAYPYRAVVPVSWLGQVRYGTATMPPVQGGPGPQSAMKSDRVPLFRSVPAPDASMPDEVVRTAGAACAAAIPQAERGSGEAVLVLRAEDAQWIVLP